jgi:tripartite-type tricarboxylate transporter receptor subunit TctC
VLGEPVIVKKAAGANSILDADYVATLPGDEHLLLFTVSTALSNNPFPDAKLPCDPNRDLAPVALVAITVGSLVIRRRLKTDQFPKDGRISSSPFESEAIQSLDEVRRV